VIASGARRGLDEVIHLWDAAGGRFLQQIDAAGIEPGRGANLALSADGKRIAAAGSQAIRIWDLASSRETAGDDEAHLAVVERIVAAGAVAATASIDHTVRVWDLATGRQRFRLQHDNWVRGVGLSPDGKHLASSSFDDTVRLWDLSTGREVYRLPGHGRWGSSRVVGFTADGRRFLSFGDDFYLRVWDVKTGKALREHRLRPTGIQVPVDGEFEHPSPLDFSSGGIFSTDGKTFVLPFGGRAFVFDVDSGKEVRILDTQQGLGRPGSAALSPDGKLLLLGGSGKQIKTVLADGSGRVSMTNEHPLELWDLGTGKRVRHIELPGSLSGPVAFSADGKTMAAVVDVPQNRIRQWDVASGAERPAIDGLPCRATALAFTPDGRRLLAALEDTSALVWNLKQP
jgi:WD40 repeat protein